MLYTRDDLDRDAPLQYQQPAPLLIEPPLQFAPTNKPYQYQPVRNERRLVCTHNKSHTTYVNYHLPLTVTTSLHCPQCLHECVTSTYDYADVIVTTHTRFTRKLALFCLNEAHDHKLPVEDYLHMVAPQSTSHGITYIHSACRSCGGTFTIVNTSTPVQATPPRYCVWCSSQDIYPTQLDTEETCYLVLAEHYNIPLVLLKHLYNIWHQSSNLTYFSQFMLTDDVTRITSKLSGRKEITATTNDKEISHAS